MSRLGGLLLSAAAHAMGLALLVAAPLFLDAAAPPPLPPRAPTTLPGIHVSLPVRAGDGTSATQRALPPRSRGSAILPAEARLPSLDGVSGIGDIAPDDPFASGAGDDPCSGCWYGAAPIGPRGAGGTPVMEPPRPRPIRPGGLVREPRRIHYVAPAYPELARQARVEGSVVIECVIDATGRVGEARVVSGHPLLAEPALDAVRLWSYTPTLLNGVPIPVLLTVTVVFELR
jgi:periplasmic protein TonB